MEIVCPKCFDEDCFFNGISYECSNCGKKWSAESNQDDDDDEY